MKVYTIPKNYQEDAPEDREGPYLELVLKSEFDKVIEENIGMKSDVLWKETINEWKTGMIAVIEERAAKRIGAVDVAGEMVSELNEKYLELTKDGRQGNEALVNEISAKVRALQEFRSRMMGIK